MSTTKLILLFFLLPFLSPLIFPPEIILGGGVVAIPIAAAFFAIIGFLLWRGRSAALTFMIFLQGLNVIIRLMMFFPHILLQDGRVDLPWVITSLLSMGLSFYLLLRLDQVDVRTRMVT